MDLPTFSCSRCGHVWIPRISRTPRFCPRCKSPYWQTQSKTMLASQQVRLEAAQARVTAPPQVSKVSCGNIRCLRFNHCTCNAFRPLKPTSVETEGAQGEVGE